MPKHAGEIAEALAKKLGPIAPTAPEDENARLSGFANVKMADYIDGAIEESLQIPSPGFCQASILKDINAHPGHFRRRS